MTTDEIKMLAAGRAGRSWWQRVLDYHLLTRRFRRIERVALILIFMGLAWRVIRYLLAFPLWGDESMVAATLVTRDLSTVTRAPLEYGQIAPALWLIAEWGISKLCGLSELSFHALSFVSGILSLLLFWKFSRQVVSRNAAVLATGILAASFYPVRHSTELKPYATDMLTSLILLMMAWSASRKPRVLWRYVVAGFFAAGVGWLSYPTIFVSAGVGVFLLYTAIRDRSPRTWGGVAVYGVLAGAGTLAMVLLYAIPMNRLTPGYDEIWKDAFPPVAEPLKFLWWLLDMHTGNMLAYPVGGKNFASTGTTLLVITGTVHLWRRRRWDVLILLYAPLALTFLASIPKRYPYGVSARTMLHVAPAFCLLAGIGLSSVLRRAIRRRLVAEGHRVVGIVLSIIIVAAAMQNVLMPYKQLANLQTRNNVKKLVSMSQPGDRWVFGHSLGGSSPLPQLSGSDAANFRVYSIRFAPGPVMWGPDVDTIPRGSGKTFLIYFDDPHGFDFSTNPPTPDADVARRKIFEAYLSKVRQRLGMELQKITWPLAQVERNVRSQVIEVYEFSM